MRISDVGIPDSTSSEFQEIQSQFGEFEELSRSGGYAVRLRLAAQPRGQSGPARKGTAFTHIRAAKPH